MTTHQELTSSPTRKQFGHGIKVSADCAESTVKSCSIFFSPPASTMLYRPTAKAVIRGTIETGLLVNVDPISNGLIDWALNMQAPFIQYDVTVCIQTQLRSEGIYVIVRRFLSYGAGASFLLLKCRFRLKLRVSFR